MITFFDFMAFLGERPPFSRDATLAWEGYKMVNLFSDDPRRAKTEWQAVREEYSEPTRENEANSQFQFDFEPRVRQAIFAALDPEDRQAYIEDFKARLFESMHAEMDAVTGCGGGGAAAEI